MQRAATLLVLLLPMVAGCATTPVFRVTSLDPDARWVQGHAVVRRDAGGVIWSAHYQRTRAGQLVFDILVENRSPDPVQVNPTGFFFTLEASEDPARYDAGKIWAARDPEQVLEQLDLLEARADSDENTRFFLDAVGGVLEAADEVSRVGERTEEERRRDDREDYRNREERARDHRQRAAQRAALARQRAEWAQAALRRTTLEPGESVTGWVVFDGRPVASYLDARYRMTHPGYPSSSSLTAANPTETDAPECVFVLYSSLAPGWPGMAFRVRRL